MTYLSQLVLDGVEDPLLTGWQTRGVLSLVGDLLASAPDIQLVDVLAVKQQARRSRAVHAGVATLHPALQSQDQIIDPDLPTQMIK